MNSGLKTKKLNTIIGRFILFILVFLSVMVSKAQFQSTQGLGNSQYTIQGSDNVFSKPVQLAKPSSQGGTQSNANGQVQGGAQANVFGGPGNPGGGVGGGGTSDPSPLPIDGGLSILLAAGVAYHLKKKKEIRFERNDIQS